MPLSMVAPAVGAKRLAGNVPASSNYTLCFWTRLGSTDQTSYRTFFYLGNDPLELYTQYVGLYNNFPQPTRNCTLEYYLDGVTEKFNCGDPINELWTPVAYVREGSVHKLYLHYVLVATFTLDMGVANFTDAWLGTDGYAAGGDLLIGRVREWNKALTFNQLLREWASSEPAFEIENLWSEAPFTADYNDISGNNRHWTPHGAPELNNALPYLETPAPGWSRKGFPTTGTGTTQVSIALPAGIANGDVVVLCLAHRGADWAVLPGVWETVARNREPTTGIRGEMHVRRHAGQAGPIVVTGMAVSASGHLSLYTGGREFGALTFKATTKATPPGQAGFVQSGTDGFPVTPPGALILFMAARAGSSTGFPSCLITRPIANSFQRSDPDIFENGSPRTLNAFTSTGGGSCVWLIDRIKLTPGPMINDCIVSMSPYVGDVVIMAALIPHSYSPPAAVRYYFAKGAVGPPLRWPFQVGPVWDVSLTRGPHQGDGITPYFGLTKHKAMAGKIDARDIATNQQNNYDIMIGRFYSRPLQAQTFTGTVNACLGSAVKWLGAAGYSTASVARLRLHIYVTVGQTNAVRSVLLDNHVHTVNINNGLFQPFWQTFNAGLSVAGTCEDGDSIVVEAGMRVISSPTPTPTYPPTEWTRLWQLFFGACHYRLSAYTGSTVPVQDGSPGNNSLLDPSESPNAVYSDCPFIDFTGGIKEKPWLRTLPNIAPDLATEIPAIGPWPWLSEVYNTEASCANAHALWFKWTPTESRAFHMHAIPSYGSLSLDWWTATDPADYTTFVRFGGGWGRYLVTAGTTYYIRHYVGSGTPCNAAMLQFAIDYWDETLEEDDLYLNASAMSAWRDGRLLKASGDLAGYTASGIAIDYSKKPIKSYDGPIHADERLIVQLFSGETIEVLDLKTLNYGVHEIDYFLLKFPTASGGGHSENLAALQVKRDGTIYSQSFGNGFLYVIGWAGGIPAAMNAPSNIPKWSTVRGMAITDGEANNNFTNVPFASELVVPPQASSPWHGTLDEATGVLYYTSGGHYLPMVPSDTIKRYNVVTQTPMPDFVTLELHGYNTGLKGMCLHPDGGMFVCNGDRVHRLNPTGTIVSTYIAESIYPITLVDVKLTANMKHIWVLCANSSILFKFDVKSAAQVKLVETRMSPGNAIQIALYQPKGFTPEPVIEQKLETRVIRRVRQAPYIASEHLGVIHDWLEIEMQVGIGKTTGFAKDPVVYLSWSDTSGRTWSNEYPLTVGQLGDYLKVTPRWRKLGKASRGRIYRVVVSDPVDWALVDAYLGLKKGTR